MKIEKLYKNEFLKNIIELMENVLRLNETNNGPEKWIRKVRAIKETEKDIYVLDVFETITKMLGTVEQLNYIPSFLQRFPIRRFYNEKGINQPKYFQYHLEFHCIKISTLLDQMAILINEVFRLGIPLRKCSVDMMLENKFTKSSKSAEVLRNFKESIQDIKTVRNLIVHRGEFEDDELKKVNMYYFFREQSLAYWGKEDEISEPYLESITIRVKKNISERVNRNNDIASAHIDQLFTSLNEEFLKRYHQMN